MRTWELWNCSDFKICAQHHETFYYASIPNIASTVGIMNFELCEHRTMFTGTKRRIKNTHGVVREAKYIKQYLLANPLCGLPSSLKESLSKYSSPVCCYGESCDLQSQVLLALIVTFKLCLDNCCCKKKLQS